MTYTSGLAHENENDEQETPAPVFAPPGHGHTPSSVTTHALTHIDLTHPNHVVPGLAILAHPDHIIPSLTILAHPDHIVPSLTILAHPDHIVPSLTILAHPNHIVPSHAILIHHGHSPSLSSQDTHPPAEVGSTSSIVNNLSLLPTMQPGQSFSRPKKGPKMWHNMGLVRVTE
ncbi:hypothetical protein BS47DRAFT_1394326 [Hydnum rufescens UP504]|uniref:Uncharacterized protein n=1 Tax=Hydnum rufescens UP504 TaxID=1448309 RepID=A0A9P6AVU2_9AGAM|nr:hypothetical protein BS47DRAFT_1394326 [Hydnum rufescens UP504]